MSGEWQFYPIVSKDESIQAQRDASTLYDQVACVSDHYRIDRDRMGRALQALAAQWKSWAERGKP